MDPTTDAIERVKQADRRALSAQLAYAAGKWNEYWQAEGAAATKRIEESYERSKNPVANGG